MDFVVVGEDAVTQEIIKKLISFVFTNELCNCRPEPVRGGQIKSLALKYNKLNSFIFLLTDLDTYDCPPTLINDWLPNIAISPKMIFRVACPEAEAWLISDRIGFSKYFGLKSELIPIVKNVDKRNPENIELYFPYKPSLFLIRELIGNSSNIKLKQMLQPRDRAKKGSEYNFALLPFIKNKWNIEEARKNSYSLNKAIIRLNDFKDQNEDSLF
ncbi:MAG: hypothetical protein HW421_3455 [Ignavibacteria bacterium]|nr:hypothetical protein [Ignavibacteria bacterium]